MRGLTSLLIAVAISTSMIASGPRRAYGCSCMQLPSDEPAARTRLADATEYGAVTLIGTVDETMGSVNEPAAVMETERTMARPYA